MISGIKKYFQYRFTEIDSWQQGRDVEHEIAIFDRVWLRALVAIVMILVICYIYEVVTPPKSITLTVNENPEVYQKHAEARVYFSSAQTPSELKSDISKKTIQLPYGTLSKLPGYQKNGIWYEFHLSIPEDKFILGDTAVLVPLLWGKSKVFVNGKLYGYGKDYQPLIGISERNIDIQIRGDTTNSAIDSPIASTYPVLVGPIENLTNLVNTMKAQAMTEAFSPYSYIVAFLLFAGIFVSYGRRPELFSFLLFLFTSAIYGRALALNGENKIFLFNREFQQWGLVVLDFLTNAGLLLFSYLFFRVPRHLVVKRVLTRLYTIFAIGASSTFLLHTWNIGPSSFRQIGHLIWGVFFFIVQMEFCLPQLSHLLFKIDAPKLRKTTGVFVVAAIVSVAFFNIMDAFNLLSAVTTQYRNGFLVYLVLAVFVGMEAGRSERLKRKLTAMVSKEAKQGLEFEKAHVSNKGFVVLIDAVGFSANRETFEDVNEMRKSAENIFGAFTRAIIGFQASGLSLLNTTGDGLYLSLTGEPSKELFDTATAIATRIIHSAKDTSLRVAIGYGEYTVFIMENSDFHREFCLGGVLNDLSRIIGGNSVRILISDETKKFLGNKKIDIKDKHGHTHQFTEIDPKVAA